MLNVKITIASIAASVIIPHYCCNCGELGQVLCASCKYDITCEPFSACVSCLGPSHNGKSCNKSYSHIWTVGFREGALEKLIGTTKFHSIRQGADIQAELLDGMLPSLPEDVIVVPIPTIRPHIRVRGFGHAERIARVLARRRNVAYYPVMGRINNFVQHGATRQSRTRQAAQSFTVVSPIDPTVTYLIVDDVYTTGSTVEAVAKLLRQAGAGDVWVAVTSRQPKG